MRFSLLFLPFDQPRTKADPPVIARIAGDRVLLDPRTVLPGQEQTVLEALRRCAQDRR